MHLGYLYIKPATLSLSISMSFVIQSMKTINICLLLLAIAINSSSSQDYFDPVSGGSWEVVVPRRGGGSVGKSLNMQSVHAALLPSGSIILASGSSWRNRGPIETYPGMTDPKGGQGVFRQQDDPFHNNKIEDYYQLVNNVGIYNPSANTFYRIPHPVPVPDPKWRDHFVPTDLFCTGHLHVPDGNVLFVGGTQYYYPFRTGHRAAFLFDWRKETNITWNKIDWRRISPTFSSNNSHNPWIFAGKTIYLTIFVTISTRMNFYFYRFDGTWSLVCYSSTID